MLRTTLILSLFFCLTFGQTLDSLKDEIENRPLEEQLEILSDETWANRSRNPAYALQCGKLGLSIAESLDNQVKAAQINNFLGVVQRNIGNYAEALRYYNEALSIATSINDSVQMAYSYNNIGGAYRLEQNYNLALENMFAALNIFSKLNDERGKAYCSINIGIVFRMQGNYDKAMDYFQQTIEIRKKIDDEFGQALALNQVVEIYYDQRKLNLALVKYRELLALYESLNDGKGIAAALGGIGGVKYLQGQFKEAKNYRERALEIQREIKNVDGMINNLNELSLIYLKLGDEKAEKVLEEAKKLSDQTQLISPRIRHLKTRAEFFKLKGEYDTALEYFYQYSSLKDSLNKKVNIESIASMEAVHRVNIANKENQILIRENELQSRQNLFLLILAVVLILFISFGIYKYFQNRTLTAKLKELNYTKDKFFSIIAHDLKNPFNNLLGYSEMLAEDFEEMTDDEKRTALTDFNKSSKKLLLLVENLLDWSRANIGALQYNPEELSLLEVINDVVSLYNGNIKSKNLKLILDVPSSLTVYTDNDFLYLVTRNLLNNAIKFSKENGKITISASEVNSHHQVDFVDEGVGIDREKLQNLFKLGNSESTTGTHEEKGSGLGLILVHDLVKKWGGEISVESRAGKGSKFSITIPKSN